MYKYYTTALFGMMRLQIATAMLQIIVLSIFARPVPRRSSVRNNSSPHRISASYRISFPLSVFKLVDDMCGWPPLPGARGVAEGRLGCLNCIVAYSQHVKDTCHW